MSTVAARTFASTPQRHADTTWMAIVDLLTKGKTGSRRDELMSVSGIATSVIADRAPEDAAIIVTCDGPRTRIRCVYDEDAIAGADVNEDALGFDPLNGEWAVSLPCDADDLSWVQKALKAHSSRITARDKSEAIATKADAQSYQGAELVIDEKEFLSQ